MKMLATPSSETSLYFYHTTFITPQTTAIVADKPKDTQGYTKHSYPTPGNHISCQRPL